MTVSLEPGKRCVVCQEDKRERFFATAAAAEGIAPSTMHGRLERHPGFRALLDGAAAGAIITNPKRINQAAEKGGWRAAAWLLERSCPESFGRREGLDISLPQIDLTQLEEAGAELIEGVAITTDVHVADAWVK